MMRIGKTGLDCDNAHSKSMERFNALEQLAESGGPYSSVH
jgi:hypothetical protein